MTRISLYRLAWLAACAFLILNAFAAVLMFGDYVTPLANTILLGLLWNLRPRT